MVDRLNLRLYTGITCVLFNTPYAWDYENRMISATLPDESIATYTYDGDGLRRQSEAGGSTVKFIWDEQDVLMETNAGRVERGI